MKNFSNNLFLPLKLYLLCHFSSNKFYPCNYFLLRASKQLNNKQLTLKLPHNPTGADKDAPMPTSTKISNVKLSTISSLINCRSQTSTKEIKTFALLLSSAIQNFLTTPLQLVPEAQLFTHRLITSSEIILARQKRDNNGSSNSKTGNENVKSS